VSVLDCARANICAMSADAVGRYYNVGTGKRTSLKELAELLLQLTGSNQPIRYMERSQATLVRNRVGSTKRAAREIGFTTEVDLREGLQRLIEWRASHRAGLQRRRAKAAVD
jgi:nucleoside-diphosphate-sugar epimerase